MKKFLLSFALLLTACGSTAQAMPVFDVPQVTRTAQDTPQPTATATVLPDYRATAQAAVEHEQEAITARLMAESTAVAAVATTNAINLAAQQLQATMEADSNAAKLKLSEAETKRQENLFKENERNDKAQVEILKAESEKLRAESEFSTRVSNIVLAFAGGLLIFVLFGYVCWKIWREREGTIEQDAGDEQEYISTPNSVFEHATGITRAEKAVLRQIYEDLKGAAMSFRGVTTMGGKEYFTRADWERIRGELLSQSANGEAYCEEGQDRALEWTSHGVNWLFADAPAPHRSEIIPNTAQNAAITQHSTPAPSGGVA